MTVGAATMGGDSVPLHGEFELKGLTAATDFMTMTGVASQSGDFLVMRNSSETERFVVEDGGNVVITVGAVGDIGLRITSLAAATGNFITLENSAGTDILTIGPDGALYTGRDTTTGQIVAGGTTMIYGRAMQRTTALTGDLIGVKGNARVAVASAAGSAYGGYFQAGSGTSATGADAVNLLKCTGLTAQVVVAAAAATVANVQGIDVICDVNAATAAITTLMGIRVAIQTGSSQGTHTNSAGIVVINEDVQGTGAVIGAGLAIGNISCAIGFTYLVDLGPTITDGGNGTVVACSGHSADIRFSNGCWFVALASTITANSTTTSAPAGSIGITSGTGSEHSYRSDGTKWQYSGVS